VSARRLTDELRSDQARRRREERAAARVPADEHFEPVSVPDFVLAEEDDTLTLFFLCAHPALSPAPQLALTLRAVGGLTTTEIVRAFLVPERTIAGPHQPRQAEHQGQRHPVQPSTRARARGSSAGRAARPLLDLQRGLYGVIRP
jgi:hypothetical protein